MEDVYSLLSHAVSKERHDEHTVFLTGDLCQMASQGNFLRSHGIDVQYNDVYPCVMPCDRERTFKLIWEYGCDGWWHYLDIFVELGLCTKEKFMDRLKKQVESRKEEK